MQMYEDAHGHGLQSITDLATPSIRSSQDIDTEVAFSKNVSAVQDALQTIAEGKEVTMAFRPSEDGGTDPAAVTMRNESLDDHLLPKIRSILNHVADYPMTRRNHEHRLDQLENGSFSHGFIEDMRDQHELLETRVQDLETRMDDVEKQNMNQVDRSSIGSRQLLDASMDSRSSSALISSAIDRLDSSRIEALEAQILELQAAGPPSHSKPWEIEVVFLPFGPRMMGIWSSQNPSQRSRMNSASGDECTQTQHSLAAEQARLTTHNEATAWEKRVPDFDDDHMPWLMPRACGRRSRIDERLRSRGLVRKIQVKGPDARDVQAAMLSAFGSLPDTLAQDPYSDENHHITIPESLNQYIGLRAPWIPLRKDHKISALRFLNIGEMLTPSLWTVNFLSSSVVMKASGIRRLYVTHPASYVQHLGPTTSWTWQKLRQLDRVYPDMDPNHTPEADAHEPCWEFDERYDSPPSLQASLTSQEHSLSIRSRHRTRSPSRPRDTPRWSVGPPSPYAYVEEFSHKRGTTPFAYATPHSNAPYNDRSSQYFGHGQKDDEELGSTTDDSDIEGGDQNALSDFDGGEGDEWEGLQDQDQGKSQSGESDCPSEYPSRQPDTQGGSFGDENASGKAMAGFMIHVDEEVDD
ncbi:hypothetical protein B0O99DRAFT_528229 [Bisporella sp. PMI_857]|nr:hypothetical protein B0O99DRAFT_528229 [Bisporella sp. PMI_857]